MINIARTLTWKEEKKNFSFNDFRGTLFCCGKYDSINLQMRVFYGRKRNTFFIILTEINLKV